MNPFNNRWSALLLVGAIMFCAAALIGTGEDGVLSRANNVSSASDMPAAAVEAATVETHPEDQAVSVAVEDTESQDDMFDDGMQEEVADEQADVSVDEMPVDDGIAEDGDAADE